MSSAGCLLGQPRDRGNAHALGEAAHKLPSPSPARLQNWPRLSRAGARTHNILGDLLGAVAEPGRTNAVPPFVCVTLRPSWLLPQTPRSSLLWLLWLS
jgi:hypothetical protein